MAVLMQRGAAIIILLAAPLAWPCSPEMPWPHIQRSGVMRHLTLQVDEEETSLIDAKGQTLWAMNQPMFVGEALFAEDESWVAMHPDDGELVVASTAAGSKPHRLELHTLLTEAERARVPRSMCGTQYLESWVPDPRGVHLVLSQSSQSRPTKDGLHFLVTPDGKATRVDPLAEVDVGKLAESWSGPSSTRREDVLVKISRMEGPFRNREHETVFAPLIQKVFAVKDASERELVAGAQLFDRLSPSQIEDLAPLTRAHPKAEAAMLRALRESPWVRAHARAVFDDATKADVVRAAALERLIDRYSTPNRDLLNRGLSDKGPLVRTSALRRVNVTSCRDMSSVEDALAHYPRGVLTDAPVWPAFSGHREAQVYRKILAKCLDGYWGGKTSLLLAEAVEKGLRLDDADSHVPSVYVSAARCLEKPSPQAVPKLLSLAEKAATKSRSAGGLAEVLQWRFLRAVKFRDWKSAEANLERLRSNEIPDNQTFWDLSSLFVGALSCDGGHFASVNKARFLEQASTDLAQARSPVKTSPLKRRHR